MKYHTDLHQTNVLPDIKITGNYHHLTLQIIDEANNVVVQITAHLLQQLNRYCLSIRIYGNLGTLIYIS